ncbi:hypothetical protein IMG5_131060, partial [Ichthyophthirius multifiliis]
FDVYLKKTFANNHFLKCKILNKEIQHQAHSLLFKFKFIQEITHLYYYFHLNLGVIMKMLRNQKQMNYVLYLYKIQINLIFHVNQNYQLNKINQKNLNILQFLHLHVQLQLI